MEPTKTDYETTLKILDDNNIGYKIQYYSKLEEILKNDDDINVSTVSHIYKEISTGLLEPNIFGSNYEVAKTTFFNIFHFLLSNGFRFVVQNKPGTNERSDKFRFSKSFLIKDVLMGL